MLVLPFNVHNIYTGKFHRAAKKCDWSLLFLIKRLVGLLTGFSLLISGDITFIWNKFDAYNKLA